MKKLFACSPHKKRRCFMITNSHSFIWVYDYNEMMSCFEVSILFLPDLFHWSVIVIPFQCNAHEGVKGYIHINVCRIFAALLVPLTASYPKVYYEMFCPPWIFTIIISPFPVIIEIQIWFFISMQAIFFYWITTSLFSLVYRLC